MCGLNFFLVVNEIHKKKMKKLNKPKIKDSLIFK